VKWRLDNRQMVKTRYRAAAVVALRAGTEHMLEESNRTIPHETGAMAGSGVASVDARALKGAFSWNTPYAVRQHEDTRLRHDQGRRAKWAEQTMREQAGRVLAFLAARMKAAL
jgi:hypothetical protein